MPREVFKQTRMALEYAMRSIQANQDGFRICQEKYSSKPGWL
jgi:hypothetical protein